MTTLLCLSLLPLGSRFDVTFYANALFAPAVLAAIFVKPLVRDAAGAALVTPSPSPYQPMLPHSSGIDEIILRTLVTYLIGLPGPQSFFWVVFCPSREWFPGLIQKIFLRYNELSCVVYCVDL
jgi:hypothetical protein